MKGRSHRLQNHHESHEDWVDGSWTVDCVCGVNFDDGEEMVNCDECGVWVHTRCSRYVKGDELFACDKCKTKNNRHNDSEETEVAQLLVELPTKTIRLGSNYAMGNESHACHWSNPMERRVHVQGIPGGDPALFSGLSSVFTPELWKCTGYVPKKFNFQYREFPCWDENVERDGRNEEENENTIDKGAGVLFSLSKKNVLAEPVKALVGVRGMDEEVSCDRKQLSKKWKNGDRESGRSYIGVEKGTSLIRPVVIHSAKRKKEDVGTLKDRSSKKAQTAEKEVDAKKRCSHTSKAVAFTSTSDAKPLEFYEDRGPKSFKDENQSTKNKNTRDSSIQEHESDGFVAGGNGIGKPKSNFELVEHSSEALSSDVSRHNFPNGTELKEDKVSPEVAVMVESPPKQVNLAVTVQELHENGKMPVKHEGDGIPNGILDDGAEGSVGSDLKPPVYEPASAPPEDKGNQIDDVSDKSPSSIQPSVKEELENDNANGVLNCQSSVGDVQDARLSNDNMSENSKINDASVSDSPSNEPKADKTSETISDYRTNVADELTADPCQHKQEPGVSVGSIAMLNSPSASKHELGFEDPSKPGGTVLSTSVLPSQQKVVLSVGKSISSAATSSRSPASDKFKSRESQNFDPNSKQQTMLECNGIRKHQVVSDAVKDEDSSNISKLVKERPKFSVNSTSKVPNSSKFSHTSVLKRTISDSKDSLLYPSPKASSAQHSCETTGSLQKQAASQVQNKAPAPGLALRSEKVNVSNSYLQSKRSHTVSTNPPVLANPPATLSDEELALLLHQELNSSPRVPRVPRRHAGSLPHLASPTATSMLVKRTSSYGGKDQSLVPRRKSKDPSKDVMCRYHEAYDEVKRTSKVPSSPDQRKDKGCTTDGFSGREDDRSSTAVHSFKKNISPTSTSTANNGPPSSMEVNDQHLSSICSSPRNFSDEETGILRSPVHRTLPGLINEIMSKGRCMTYEELCNAVLPHWHNLRKHNGERYAYSSHSQAVLDCLRNRHEWARLVDRGPKTSSSRKRRKFDTEESEDDDEYGKERTAREEDQKSVESQREDFPKGKRKARKRRRLALQGRGIKDVRKRRKADLPSDDDSDSSSNSSEESLFSEDENQGDGAGPFGSETSANSDEIRAM